MSHNQACETYFNRVLNVNTFTFFSRNTGNQYPARYRCLKQYALFDFMSPIMYSYHYTLNKLSRLKGSLSPYHDSVQTDE